jgi:hypothetical protein
MDGWRIIYRRTSKNSVMVFLLLLWFLIDINPNPHGRGYISPYYIFSKASTQKVLKCHKSPKISYSKKNFCWIDILGYVSFMPQNRPMPEEIWANSVYHLSRPSYFCPHPGGGQGGDWGWGKVAISKNRAKSHLWQKRDCSFNYCWPQRPLSTSYLN